METPNKIITAEKTDQPNDVAVRVVSPEADPSSFCNRDHDANGEAMQCAPQPLLGTTLFDEPVDSQASSGNPVLNLSPELDPSLFCDRDHDAKAEADFRKARVSLQPNVKKVYSIVSNKTGSIGGNGHGGAIYGETTSTSLQKIIELMKIHTGFNQSSRFIDVGSGLGKPNLHVAQDPGVSFSYGVEMERVRWMLSMHNLRHVLKHAELQSESNTIGPEELLGFNCFFAHGDITEASSFNPFTHVYMFDIGFPPKLFEKLSEMFNRSSSSYLICYHPPRLIVDRYKFRVELLCQQNTTMHGSSENHIGYIYRRKTARPIRGTQRQKKIPCDPFFKESWDHVQMGLDHMCELVDKKLSTALESGRVKRCRTLTEK